MLKSTYNRTFNRQMPVHANQDFNEYIDELSEEFSILHGHTVTLLDSLEDTTEKNSFAEYDFLSRLRLTCVYNDGSIRYFTYYICQSIY